MNRIANVVIGLVFLPAGVFFVFGGGRRFYRAATLMTEPNLPPDVASGSLLEMIVGLLVVAVGFWGARAGWAGLADAFRRKAAGPSPAAAAVPTAAEHSPAVLTLTHAGQTAMLTAAGGDALIGRGADCGIIVQSKYASRHHARVEWDAAGAPRLVNLGQWGTSVRRPGESAYRVCEPDQPLEGEGEIALSSDGTDAQGRGDVVRFVLAAQPVRTAAPVAPVAMAVEVPTPAPVLSARMKSDLAKFVAGFAVVAIYNAVAKDKVATEANRAEMKTAMQEVQRSADIALQKGAGSGPIAAPPDSAPPVAKGEAGKVERVLKGIINRGVAERREYELELQAIGWGRILDVQRLRKDATLAESKTMVQQARTIVAKHRAGADALRAQIRRDVEQSDLSPEDKRGILAGIDRGMAAEKARSDEAWGLEEQTVAQFEGIFTLLSSKRSTWKIRDDKIVFGSQADLDQFRGYLARVDQISAKQESIRKTAADRARESFKSAAK